MSFLKAGLTKTTLHTLFNWLKFSIMWGANPPIDTRKTFPGRECSSCRTSPKLKVLPGMLSSGGSRTVTSRPNLRKFSRSLSSASSGEVSQRINTECSNLGSPPICNSLRLPEMLFFSVNGIQSLYGESGRKLLLEVFEEFLDQFLSLAAN